MTDPILYMRRCLELAQKGIGFVAPNPMVGAVLVYQDRIIGEGWHEQFGGPHAEVNCLKQVLPEDRIYIPESTLYVSLEPCSHHGKTPPCTGLILEQGIRKVVIGCEDPFPSVSGSGIRLLREKGVEVMVGLLEQECKKLNRRFITYHQKRRPYVVLKWAQTADGFIGSGNSERLIVSGNATNSLVHKWRSEESAILIGSNTALQDNPLLTARWGNRSQPVRIVVDRNLKLRNDLRIFKEGGSRLMVFNDLIENQEGGIQYVCLSKHLTPAMAILDICYNKGIQSILVEGGRKILQFFLDACLWDEARQITNTSMVVHSGISSPAVQNIYLDNEFFLMSDRIQFFYPNV